MNRIFEVLPCDAIVGKNCVLINLDLIFDIHSLLFTIYRHYYTTVYPTINFNNEWKSKTEFHNVKNSLETLTPLLKKQEDSISIDKDYEAILSLARQYIITCKPTINSIETLNALGKAKNVAVYLTSKMESELLEAIKKANEKWLNTDIIALCYKSLQCAMTSGKIIVIDGNYEFLVQIKEPEIVKVLLGELPTPPTPTTEDKQKMSEEPEDQKKEVLVFKTFEDIPWAELLGEGVKFEYPAKEYFLKLKEDPTSMEAEHWDKYVKLDNEVVVESKIIHGFGRGGKKLGIPTANLEITEEIQKEIANVMVGVYYGYAEFVPHEDGPARTDLNYGVKYPMVMSIGFNPYFNDKYKSLEVHIFNNFEKDFYDLYLKVYIKGFIRSETNFKYFDHLIKFIHNDVYFTRKLLGAN
jgi:riboflavin kinase